MQTFLEFARVVSWEISGNFLWNFSGNLSYKNVMKRIKKRPHYHLIAYVRLKNSSN